MSSDTYQVFSPSTIFKSNIQNVAFISVNIVNTQGYIVTKFCLLYQVEIRRLPGDMGELPYSNQRSTKDDRCLAVDTQNSDD